MTKVEVERMTWREAQEAFGRNPVVLLPMGSVEQHGPHVPVGDYRYATVVARRIAEQAEAIVAPTIPWGYSEHFRPFPGTLSVRPETLTLLLEDTCDGFVRFGLDHLLFVCGHKGNMPILEQVANCARRTGYASPPSSRGRGSRRRSAARRTVTRRYPSATAATPWAPWLWRSTRRTCGRIC